MQFESVKTLILHELKTKLSAHLHYHSAKHTTGVLNDCDKLAKTENVSGDDLILLLTAALFHDAGFLEGYENHEKISCSIAHKYLPHYDYSDAQIEKICEIIMSTKLPQSPKNKLAEILCDADLYYLGTDEYYISANSLYKEFLHFKVIKNEKEWNLMQIKFLKSHHYFTPFAIQDLTVKKNKHLATLHSEKRKKESEQKLSLHLSDALLILCGVLITAFGLKGFLVPNNFFDGGVTGISLLIHDIYNFPLAYVIVIVNLPFIIMSMYVISARFGIKTFFCIVLLGVCLYFIPYPIITTDKLLISVFGGFFLGVGIGLTMRAGAALDGIEVLALYTWRRTSFTISEIILVLNAVIFSIAAFKFGIQTALYSMLTYFTASKTIDYVIEGIQAYTGVTIISGKSELIKYKLVNELGRGITIYKGERGFLPDTYEIHEDCDIIFTVITRLELRKLKTVVSEIDENAFVFASTIKEASGGVIKRRHVH